MNEEDQIKTINACGIELYNVLVKEFGCDSVQKLDAILNTLCFALMHLMINHIDKAKYQEFKEIVMQILNQEE